MPETSRHRKIEIAKIMVDLAKETAVPQGVKNYEICNYEKLKNGQNTETRTF